MEVEFNTGGEIQAEGVASDEQMRESMNASALKEQMAQVEQGNAQGCPTMPRVTLRPELFGEGLAQMDAAFHRQIDEQRKLLERGALPADLVR
jgi:hypothetical protein